MKYLKIMTRPIFLKNEPSTHAKSSLITMRCLILLLFALSFSGCNYNYYLAKQERAKSNYEIANVYFHRAFSSDPDDQEFIDAYLQNSVDTSTVLLKRYSRYIEEKKYLPAYFLLQRAKELKSAQDEDKIKQEEKKWLKVLIAGKINYEFDRVPEYASGSSRFAIAIRFNTPNSDLLVAEIDPLTGLYFVEDYLYDPPQEYLMFYTINSIGVKTQTSIDSLRDRIDTKVESSTGKEKQRIKISNAGDNLTSDDFIEFINFSVPVVTEAKGELDYGDKYLSLQDNFIPSSAPQLGEAWSPERGIRFSALLDGERIVINSNSLEIDFSPELLFYNTKANLSFLDFGEKNVILSSDLNLWKIQAVRSEGLGYREKLLKNKLLLSYLTANNGVYPFIKEKS